MPDPPSVSRPTRPPGNFTLLMVGNALVFTSGIATLLHYRLVSLGVGWLGMLIAAAGFVRHLRWSRRAR
jgi:hypothetical protein